MTELTNFEVSFFRLTAHFGIVLSCFGILLPHIFEVKEYAISSKIWFAIGGASMLSLSIQLMIWTFKYGPK